MEASVCWASNSWIRDTSCRSRCAPSVANAGRARSRWRWAVVRAPVPAASRATARWLKAAWYRSPRSSNTVALCAKSWCADVARPDCAWIAPRTRRYSAQLAVEARGSSRSSQPRSRSRASSTRPASSSASHAVRLACSSSNGGMPAVCASSSAIASAWSCCAPAHGQLHRQHLERPLCTSASSATRRRRWPAAGTPPRGRTCRASDESARGCRTPRRSSRGTSPDF